jgi:hypothetical protein
MQYNPTEIPHKVVPAFACPTCEGTGTNNPVSSVSAFRAKRAAASPTSHLTFNYGPTSKKAVEPVEPALAVEPVTASVLPGDEESHIKRAFRVFTSMREAFAVPATA